MQSTVETAPNQAIHLCWKQSDQLCVPAISISRKFPFLIMATGQAKNQYVEFQVSMFPVRFSQSYTHLQPIFRTELQRVLPVQATSLFCTEIHSMSQIRKAIPGECVRVCACVRVFNVYVCVCVDYSRFKIQDCQGLLNLES